MKNGWEVKKIGEVCEIKPPKREARNKLNETDVVSFAPMEALGINQKFLIPTKERILKEVGGSYTYFANGDVLLAKITPCFENGKLGIAKNLKNGIGFGSSEYIVFRTNENLFSEYLYYFLLRPQFKEEGAKRMKGAVGHKRVSKEFIEDCIISLPPMTEQKRIVAVLDEAFESIAKAKESAEKNLKNANEIFESYVQSVFENKGEGWEEKTLGSLSEFVSVGHVGPTSKFYCEKHEGIPFLRSQNVRPAKLSMKGIRFILPEFHIKLKKSQLKSGDLLFVRVGANRGDCCSLPENIGEINCANIVFSRPTEASSKFLELFCLSQIGRKRLLGMTTGSAQGVINTKSVAELLVPLPNIKEQLAIEKKFNLISSETKKLEAIYTQKLADLEELKRSILAKAFNGELTEASA